MKREECWTYYVNDILELIVFHSSELDQIPTEEDFRVSQLRGKGWYYFLARSADWHIKGSLKIKGPYGTKSEAFEKGKKASKSNIMKNIQKQLVPKKD